MNCLRISIILLSVFVLSLSVSSEEKQDIEYHLQYKEANMAFAEEKDPNIALDLYLDILKERGPSLELLGGISNAYYQKEDYGYARLFLERALVFSPSNPDLLNNRRVILEKLDLPPVENPNVIKLINTFSSNQYFVFAWVILAAPAALILIRTVAQKNRILETVKAKGFITFAICAISLSAFTLFLSAFTSKSYNYGVVIGKTAVLRQSPFQHAEEQYSVGEAEKLRIMDEHEGFYLCELSDGEGKGWISMDSFSAIVR